MTDFKLTFNGFQKDGVFIDPWEVERYVNDLLESNEELKKENQELRKYLGWQDMELEEMEDLNE